MKLAHFHLSTAVNYRLAPQYPFPCALQDCLAGCASCKLFLQDLLTISPDLFLIRPPPDAKHAAIPPSMIVVSGDSAGGGLALALLQVIRDAGLPVPAGGVLISPWCDLTHSFPSIHENTATDILPTTGLSIHKPSSLWPPPSEEMTQSMRQNLTKKILRFTRLGHHRNPSAESVAITSRGDFKTTTPRTPTSTAKWGTVGHASTSHSKVPSGSQPASAEFGLSPSVILPALEGMSHSEPLSGIRLMISEELVTIRSQLHFYCSNHLMTHPLISPVTSYLGGLPPLFIMASDKEVLRDEILYMCVSISLVNGWDIY
jgi:acetyl esterase/lipase